MPLKRATFAAYIFCNKNRKVLDFYEMLVYNLFIIKNKKHFIKVKDFFVMKKKRDFICVDYMFTWKREEVKDMYEEVRQAYPDNILGFKKSGRNYYIYVYDFDFVEDF